MNMSYILNGVIIVLITMAIGGGISVSLDVATLKADMVYVKKTVLQLARRPVVIFNPRHPPKFTPKLKKMIPYPIYNKVDEYEDNNLSAVGDI